jgi:hypothetical protein
MIQLTGEEYARLLWCAIHDDRKLPNAQREITKHWDELPQEWKNRFHERNRLAWVDTAGAEVRFGRE